MSPEMGSRMFYNIRSWFKFFKVFNGGSKMSPSSFQPVLWSYRVLECSRMFQKVLRMFQYYNLSMRLGWGCETHSIQDKKHKLMGLTQGIHTAKCPVPLGL